MQEPELDASAVPRLNPIYLMRWEETQQAHILLYPEGVVKLNETAAEILELCSGERSIADISETLIARYEGDAVAPAVRRFLEAAHAKGWIRTDA